ncbi:probable insulin-like peptide 2 [Drosophila busckii]|nr:probable insulin-like peptide 2 [Drosophila busckii]
MFNKFSVTLAMLLALCALSSSREVNMRLCSDMLNQALSKMCEKTGFNDMVSKRSSYAALGFDPIDPIQFIEAKESADVLPYPLSNGRMSDFYDNNVISSLTATRRLTRNGIIEHCCMRACSKYELSGYCRAP